MKTISKAYAELGNLLMSPSFISSPASTFRSACTRIGVAPADMDSVIREELGMDGETLFLIFSQKSLNL